MRFTVNQDFRYPAAECAEVFTDPDLYPTFAASPKVGVPEVVARDVDGSTVRMRIRYRFAGDLNAVADAAIERDKLTWVDESVHDLEARTVTFVLHPDHYGKQFRGRGSYRFVDTDDGCRRVADIEVKVSFPLVGHAVEAAIASGLEEYLGDEQRVVERYLDAR